MPAVADKQSGWPMPFLVAACVMLPADVRAQGSIDVRPSAAITELYDSNLFGTASSPQADFITRFTPSVDSDYRSPRLRIAGRYTFDAERYDTRADLSSMDARQHGAFDVRYALTPGAALSANAEISKTRMPGELLDQMEMILPRARASRVTGGTMFTRELDPRTGGTAEYAFSEDRIHGGVTVRAHKARLAAERRPSARTSARIEYRAEQDSFRPFDSLKARPEALMTTSAVSSHALTCGWTREVTERVSLSVNAGPRLTDGRLAPELSMSLHSRLDRGEVSMDYRRTQTTVIGVARPVDIQNVTSRVVWGARRGLSVRATPGFLRSSARGLRTDVYRIGFGLEYPIGKTLSFDMAFDTNVQSGRLHQVFADGRISRHTASIRLVATPFVKRSR